MRVEKQVLGDYVTSIFKDGSYMYMISYMGLTVAQFNDLRAKLGDIGAQCHVLKNTYIKLGLLNAGFTIPDSLPLAGDTAVVFGGDDPCPVAKALKEFSKDNDKVAFKAGLVEGSFLSAADCLAVADLPPKEILQAQLLGVLQGPSRNFVSVLNNAVAGIVNVLQAYKNKLEEAS